MLRAHRALAVSWGDAARFKRDRKIGMGWLVATVLSMNENMAGVYTISRGTNHEEGAAKGCCRLIVAKDLTNTQRSL